VALSRCGSIKKVIDGIISNWRLGCIGFASGCCWLSFTHLVNRHASSTCNAIGCQRSAAHVWCISRLRLGLWRCCGGLSLAPQCSWFVDAKLFNGHTCSTGHALGGHCFATHVWFGFDASVWCICDVFVGACTNTFAIEAVFAITEESKRKIGEAMPACLTFISEWRCASHNIWLVGRLAELPHGHVGSARQAISGHCSAAHVWCVGRLRLGLWFCCGGLLDVNALELWARRTEACDLHGFTLLMVSACTLSLAADSHTITRNFVQLVTHHFAFGGSLFWFDASERHIGKVWIGA
jgi:hypothetical protein